MTDQITLAVLTIIGFAVLLLVLGALSRRTDNLPACQDDDRVDDDEGWMPLDLDPPSGHATILQGGKVVGRYATMQRLNLRPGWQAGPKGMRPYTRKARAEWEELQRREQQP